MGCLFFLILPYFLLVSCLFEMTINRLIGGIAAELSAKLSSLSLENLENLGEALLDFQSVED